MDEVIISGEWGGKEAGSPSPHFRSKTPSTEKLVAESWREYRVFTRELRFAPELLSRLAGLM